MGASLAQAIETASIGLIALAVLIGGGSLLAGVAHFGLVAVVVLGVLGCLQTGALYRNYATGGVRARLRATRDVAFLGAIVCALLFVLSPHRWALGATIVALECAFVLELFGRFAPVEPRSP